ncbi:MAG: EamA family transporter [Clostridia bacterium]|jgi:uncharacterized membrane protein|nr:EamA family transporter [Clostridiaceae bacterium]
MWGYIWPLLLVIAANTFYHICSKSLPQNANPFISLFVTYTVGAILSLLIYFFGENPAIINDMKKLNWTSILLGLSIIGLEFGYIKVYRAGWNVSTGSLVANIGLAVVLVFVGVLLYKETITLNRLIGIVLCCVGIFFLNK